MPNLKKYTHAGLGGTFDRIHRGHHQLIRTALGIAEKITIGLTVDGFSTDKKLSHLILPFEERKQQLKAFISSLGESERASIVSLSDPFGPTIQEQEKIDCIVVTDHTYVGAEKINQKRQTIKLKPLPIIIAQLVSDEGGQYLSSTRIRKGEVSRHGAVYKNTLQADLILSTAQKEKLKPPQGILFTPESFPDINNHLKDNRRISLVGDVVSAYFTQNSLHFDLAIYDEKTQKKSTTIFSSLVKDLPRKLLENQAGTVNKDIVDLYHQIIRDNTKLIKVSGEEDLIAIALVLLEPLQSLIFYGQPHAGIVMIEVTEEKKEYYKKLITQKDI